MDLQKLMDGMFWCGYTREVKKRLKDVLPGQEAALVARVTEEAKALYAANEHMAVDAPAESNLQITSLTLATYRVLLANGIEKRAALAFVKEALIEPNRKRMELFSRVTLRLSRDPLKLLASISKGKQDKMYGEAFDFEHETDDMQTYFTTNIRKCLYHDFFRANGAPEMTPVFCAFDDVWGDVIARGEYGVKFERPTTIGWGNDMCRFQFRRTKQNN